MTPKQELIARMERAHAKGHGVRLTHYELGLLRATEIVDEPLNIAVTPTAQIPETPKKLDTAECRVQIRWLIRRDLVDCIKIEQLSFPDPWSEEDFLCALRTRNCIGMVAIDPSRPSADQKWQDTVAAFMVYELHQKSLKLLNLAVHPDYLRRGVGKQMIWRMADKLSPQRRESIDTLIRETNVGAQKFFAACGFRVSGIERTPFDDCEDDGYRMVYRLRERVEA